MGSPPPGVPPGDDAHDGAIRIFGVISVLSDKRRFGKAFATLRKFRSGDDGEPPNHHPPSTPEPTSLENKFTGYILLQRYSVDGNRAKYCVTFMLLAKFNIIFRCLFL